jgi:hypothetical protein
MAIFKAFKEKTMVRKTEHTDRRRHQRFKAKMGAIAAMMTNNRLGQIMDVSQGGLSFRYIEDNGGPHESCELKILMPEAGFYLGDLNFITVSDFPVESNLPFRSIQMRQTGLQFLQLTPKQEFQLEQFISHHTIGLA